MARIFVSYAHDDRRAAIALKTWLSGVDPSLENDIFLDVDPRTGIRVGLLWKDALRRANARCEAVICIVSHNWEASHECKTEYRVAETLNKQIICARLEPSTGDDLISEWQRCDLFGGETTVEVRIDQGPPVVFSTDGLRPLHEAISDAGISAASFAWPPAGEPDRAPYRGWQPLEEVDAAVFYGRDAQIVRAMDTIRGLRLSGVESLFIVSAPSGAGKSSFLRAGLLPRLAREDRRFVLTGIVRPVRSPVSGDTGLAAAIHAARLRFGLKTPELGEIKNACSTGEVDRLADWLTEVRTAAAAQLLDTGDDESPAPPTLVLPLDQAEELFASDAGDEAGRFIALMRQLMSTLNAEQPGLIVVATIRTDRYEAMQTHPGLAGVEAVLFDKLKPMPVAQFKEVITGPAARATQAGHSLTVDSELVDQLLADASAGADTLPVLSLTLARLYKDYGSDGRLALDEYHAMGGMNNVVRTEIDGVLATDPESRRHQLDILRSAFIPWLATINPDNDQPMRRVANWSDLPEESHPLIDKLVAKRLMVKGIRNGRTTVEVALESLLRQWEELAGWLDAERADLMAADALERAAAAWDGNRRHHDWLLTGTRLTDAEKLTTSPAFAQRLAGAGEFLTTSRNAENEKLWEAERQRRAELDHAIERRVVAEAHTADLRRRSRVMRGVLAATAIVAVLAIAGGSTAAVYYTKATKQFREATTRRLISDAQGILGGTRPGSDQQAMYELLAAHTIGGPAADAAIYSAVVQERNTIKIIPTSEQLSDVAYSPDQSLIAAAGTDHIVHLLDPTTGRQVGALEGHERLIFSIVFSPDGTTIATSSADGTARLWNVETRQQIGAPMTAGDDSVRGVAFSRDGGRLAFGTKDGKVRIWDVVRREQIAEMDTHSGEEVNAVAFSLDGRTLASGGDDETVRLWDTTSMTQIGEPLTGDGFTSDVYTIAFSPDGQMLASGGQDKVIRFWDIAAHRQDGESLPAPDGCFELEFTTDGRLVAGLGDGSVRFWDQLSRQPVGQQLVGHREPVDGIAVAPDGNRLVSVSRDGMVRIWDTHLGQPLTGHTDSIVGVTFRPGGHRVASASFDHTVRLWDADTGKQVALAPMEHTAQVYKVVFVDDGHRLASTGSDGMLRLWDPASGEAVDRIQHPNQGTDWSVSALGSDPHAGLLATGGYDHVVRLWNVDTREPVGDPLTGPGDANWWALAFSPDGKLLVGGSTDGYLQFWDVEKRTRLDDRRTHGSDAIEGLSFSPDGKLLASAGRDGTIRLWDPATRQPVGEPIEGNHGMIFDVKFSPDGRLLATANADGTIQLWDVASRTTFGDPLRGHSDWVRSVAFSDDGKRLVSGSFDNTLRIWPAVASADDLCDKLVTNMSEKQWRGWVSPDIGYVPSCRGLPTSPDAAD